MIEVELKHAVDARALHLLERTTATLSEHLAKLGPDAIATWREAQAFLLERYERPTRIGKIARPRG